MLSPSLARPSRRTPGRSRARAGAAAGRSPRPRPGHVAGVVTGHVSSLTWPGSAYSRDRMLIPLPHVTLQPDHAPQDPVRHAPAPAPAPVTRLSVKSVNGEKMCKCLNDASAIPNMYIAESLIVLLWSVLPCVFALFYEIDVKQTRIKVSCCQWWRAKKSKTNDRYLSFTTNLQGGIEEH